MLDGLLSILAPHYCYNCQKLGALVCDDCKKYIIEKPFSGCALCSRTPSEGNLCKNHDTSFDALWCASARAGIPKALVDDFKFHHKRAAYRVVAQLMDEIVPPFPPGSVLVPVPTAPKNIRARGYDHTALIVRELARRRKLPYASMLARQNNVTQHFAASARDRHAQAATFFALRSRSVVQPATHYILIDDIFTTGATLEAAVVCLKNAGATQVSAAVFLRHDNWYTTRGDNQNA